MGIGRVGRRADSSEQTQLHGNRPGPGPVLPAGHTRGAGMDEAGKASVLLEMGSEHINK